MLVSRCQKTFKRGDTLIEVLFATAIFSLLAVGGLSIMNQGSSTSERALEITLVRNEINSQAETLRFLNSSYIAAYQSGTSSYPSNTPAGQWQIIQNNTVAAASTFGANGATCSLPPTGSFILNTKKAKLVALSGINRKLAQTYAQVAYDNSAEISSADGVWIEAVRSTAVINNNQDNADYIDFNIRACWDSPGQSMPVTIGTIVRLYEPR